MSNKNIVDDMYEPHTDNVNRAIIYFVIIALTTAFPTSWILHKFPELAVYDDLAFHFDIRCMAESQLYCCITIASTYWFIMSILQSKPYLLFVYLFIFCK